MQLPAVAAGSYYLILKTDYSGNRAYETSETNNTYAVPLTIGTADLAVTSFTAPATAGPQELVSLTWTVRNSGTAAATGSYSGGCCGDYPLVRRRVPVDRRHARRGRHLRRQLEHRQPVRAGGERHLHDHRDDASCPRWPPATTS
jgi:hypothetical protein